MKGIGAMRRMALMVGVIFLSVGTTVALTPTFAAGGGGGSGGGGGGGAAKTCPKGQVYSPKKQSCVRQKSELVPDDALADYAFALAKEKRFDEALEILDQVQNPTRQRPSTIAVISPASSAAPKKASAIISNRSRWTRIMSRSGSISAKPMSPKASLTSPKSS